MKKYDRRRLKENLFPFKQHKKANQKEKDEKKEQTRR
jgi:hypothetical protein